MSREDLGRHSSSTAWCGVALVVTVVLAAVLVTWTVCFATSAGVAGAVGVAGATSDAPGEPASFYGTAIDGNETDIPGGTTIVAVVDGEVVDEITVEPTGKYGGPGTFDDKLRIDSDVGDEVTFRFADAQGPIGTSVELKPGVYELPLEFPADAVEYVHPDAHISIDPEAAAPDEEIVFSGVDSSAYDDYEIPSYHWSILLDGEERLTAEGETVSGQFDENGTYVVELEVTDSEGRTTVETSTFEVDPTFQTEQSVSDEQSSGDSGGGSSGGGGSTGGTGGGGSIGGGGGGISDTDGGIEDEKNPENATEGTWSHTETSPTGQDTESGELLASERFEIEERAPETPGTTVEFETTTIKEIVFDDDAAHGRIEILEYETFPDTVPPLPDGHRIVSASAITVPEHHRHDPAIIRALVDPAWLADTGLSPRTLTVYRLPDGARRWEALPTDTEPVDDGLLVEARTPGFSRFVIAGPVTPDLFESNPELDARSDSGQFEADGSSTGAHSSTTARDGWADGLFATGRFEGGRSDIERPAAALVALLATAGLVGWIFVPRRRRR